MQKYNPTLESVIMVETAAKKAGSELGKYQLWRSLPKSMTYQAFQRILAYLEENGKIVVSREGKVVWTWDPKAVSRMRQRVNLY